MRKLVIQLQAVDDLNIDSPSRMGMFRYIKEMYETSKHFAKKYADRVGADYYVISKKDEWGPGVGRAIGYQKFRLYDFIEDYDQILYIDSDYIIKENAPDIFDMYGEVSAVCMEIHDEGRILFSRNIGVPEKQYFNSGFMYLNKKDLLATKSMINEYIHTHKNEDCFDQSLINKVFFDADVKLTYLDPKLWNPGVYTWGEFGDHYGGKTKELWSANKYFDH